MATNKILIVDRNDEFRHNLKLFLETQNFQIFEARDFRSSLTLSSKIGFAAAIINQDLPDGNGLDLIEQMHGTTIVITSEYGSIQEAINATKRGAAQYFTKPISNEKLIETINAKFNPAPKISKHIIGQSIAIQNVLDLVDKVAQSNSTVLITGESGTGKELIAKAIHQNSDRNGQNFIPVNCGAIPSELLESELFGHIKGSFTGALNNRIGRFDLADKGTLFLDEIGELGSHLQVKLLRVLQERRFEPVGSTKTHDVDVRIIAATNIDLEVAVKKSVFREDLFYRLNVIPIHVPALRERTQDIPALLNHFVQKFNLQKKRNLLGFSSQALEILLRYSWPGNIRELENLVERLTILKGDGLVETTDLPSQYRHPQLSQNTSFEQTHFKIPDNGFDFNSAVDAFENDLILKALKKTGWNRNQAAILLNLNRTTLVEKIKKKGLRPEQVDAH